MKKIFAVLLILGTAFFFVPNHVNASWWYDFIHSDRDYEPVTCWNCNGTGICQTCDGSGTVETYDSLRESYYDEDCNDCDGSGKCSTCYGSGYQ